MFGNSGETMGEGIITIYRVFLVSFVALVILGMSSVFYAHHIDVRDVEASIMARNIVNCLTEIGGIDISDISDIDLLEYCGYGSYDGEFYISASFRNSIDEEVLSLTSGDSGVLFAQQIYGNVEFSSEDFAIYRPGYYSYKYPFIFKSGEVGELNLEVSVNDDE